MDDAFWPGILFVISDCLIVICDSLRDCYHFHYFMYNPPSHNTPTSNQHQLSSLYTCTSVISAHPPTCLWVALGSLWADLPVFAFACLLGYTSRDWSLMFWERSPSLQQVCGWWVWFFFIPLHLWREESAPIVLLWVIAAGPCGFVTNLSRFTANFAFECCLRHGTPRRPASCRSLPLDEPTRHQRNGDVSMCTFCKC